MPVNPINAIPREKITPEIIDLMRRSGIGKVADQLEERRNKSVTEKYLNKFITCHLLMEKMKNEVRKLAPLSDPVTILGETGTGKELIANALHGDREGKFVAVNCSGLPENLIEAELFGYVKGAFTGANRDTIGLFREADNGTIFLDEIGDFPYSMQGKLLRAVQEKSVRPVGGIEEIPISCRFIFATHRDIIARMKAEQFREDLYWRISNFMLVTLPLRMRLADVRLLVEYFDAESKSIKDYEDFCERIDKHKLSGNVREIQQIVRRYTVLGTMPGE